MNIGNLTTVALLIAALVFFWAWLRGIIPGNRPSVTREYDRADSEPEHSFSRSSFVDPVEPPDPPDTPREMVSMGTINPTNGELSLIIKRAESVEVCHAESAESITWSTNYPDCFRSANGLIEQVSQPPLSWQRERLLVITPANFQGDLTLSVSDEADVEVDHWSHGNVKVESNGEGRIRFGNIDNGKQLHVVSRLTADVTFGVVGAESAHFSLESAGNVAIGGINLSGALEIGISDDGNFTCDDVNAHAFSSTQSGEGNLKSGNIKVAEGLDIRVEKDGNAVVGNIEAGSVNLLANYDGDLTTGDIVSASTVRVESGDSSNDSMNTEVTIASIKAASDVDIIVGGDYPVKIPGGVTLDEGANFTLKSTMDGDTVIGGIVAHDVQIGIEDDGHITLGDLTASGSVTTRQNGDGNLTLDEITAGGLLNVRISDDGNFACEAIKAHSFELALKSDSNGNFKSDDIQVAERLEFQLDDDGNATTGDIIAGSVKLVATDDGDIIAGHISAAGSVNIETGDSYNDSMNADIKAHSIVAGHSVDITVGGDRNVEVKGGVSVESDGDFTLRLKMDGDAIINGVTAGSVDVESDDNGNVTLGDVTASGRVKTRQSNDGHITIDKLRCNSFNGEISDDGNLNIRSAVVDQKFSGVTNGYGDINLKSCNAAELFVETTDSGNITVSDGTAKRVVSKQSGSGSVSLAESFEQD